MKWIIDHQLARRNLTKSQVMKSLESYRKELEKEASAKRRSSQNNNSAKAVLANLPKQGKPINVREEMAKIIGVSPQKYASQKGKLESQRWKRHSQKGKSESHRGKALSQTGKTVSHKGETHIPTMEKHFPYRENNVPE